MAPSVRTDIPDAAETYRTGNRVKDTVLNYFHPGRFAAIEALIGEHETMLSIGCGSGKLERYISDRVETMYGLDPKQGNLSDAEQELNITTLKGAVPPIPLAANSVDAVLAVGVTEHVPDEEAFFEDVPRVLADDGTFYVTLPVEVGVGGLARYLGRCYIAPDSQEGPDSFMRYFDFTLAELLKRTPRDKHDNHRYYNYTYALEDLVDAFEDVTVRGWPVTFGTSVNLTLNVKATTPV